MSLGSAIMCVSRMRKSESCKRVDLVVALADLAPEDPVGADERVEGVAEHASRAAGHVLDGRVDHDRRALRR